jgi:hypothetical protein
MPTCTCTIAVGHQAGQRWGPISGVCRGTSSVGKTGARCTKDHIHSIEDAEVRGGSTGQNLPIAHRGQNKVSFIGCEPHMHEPRFKIPLF